MRLLLGYAVANVVGHDGEVLPVMNISRVNALLGVSASLVMV